ncbi:amidohydrolase [Egibacter rhizosphaerae]|uniref:Amidohydrolase n=2 Tax=Egibacter rhizosphaerae TaxID=1670831 RepID=A0A411YLL8_9ACTN|nr:amidohydrolase [Egibacter rhizosphaerae]
MTVHRPGFVDVDHAGRIEDVGDATQPPPAGTDHTTQRVSGVLLPGLVNVHCHSPMTLLRGSGEDLPLLQWLEEVVWPREGRMNADDTYWGMTLACAELLRFGVTTSCEMYFYPEAVVDAVRDAGSRCVVTAAVLVAPGMEHLGGWQSQLDTAIGLGDRYAGDADPRVEVGLAAHAAYTLPIEALTGIAEAAGQRDRLLQIHVAESQHEGAELEAEHGKSVPALLEDIGFFEPRRVLAAHSVWLSDEDLAIYRRAGVAVAHCPQSNTKLASGIARVTDFLEAGIAVGLGTDGPASNNDLDLWEEARLAPLLQRARTGEATALPAEAALGLPTRGGAQALGRPDLGVLERGRWADLVRLETADAAFVPMLTDRDLLAHLVWSASSRHVRDVWVAGRRVVANGVVLTVDEERARAEVQQRAERLATG